MLVADVLGSARREFTADEGLHVGDVGDVPRGDGKHHEAPTRLLHQQTFGSQVQQCLTHRRGADPEFTSELIQPQILSGPVRAVEDPPPDIARNVFG